MNQIEELEVDRISVDKALEFGRSSRVLNNSITNGEANAVSKLGELLVQHRLPHSELKSTYDYDLVVDGHTVDVKTKRCTSPPRIDYDCSIAAFNTIQGCEYYVFVRILEDMTRAWLLGGIRKDRYFELATFCRQGEADPKSNCGYRFHCDCYNLEISKLGRLRSIP
jgi:hypothetical protein